MSVVIPTALSSVTLTSSVESAVASAAASGADSEVILVANGSGSDSAVPRIDSPLYRVIRLSRASAPGARNAGFEAARNDTVVFTDDDCVVPASWCADLGRALEPEPVAAVAAPIDVVASGPVTGFLRHQHAFDAPAVDAERVRYMVGANFGVRRDRLPTDLRFDDVRFGNASEDSDLGYRTREAGHDIRWLGGTEPVRHILPDRLSEVTARFERYGRGNARLSMQPDRWREAVPDALGWYRSICAGTHTDYRTFGEVAISALRPALSTCHLAFAASYLIGYLDELGAILGVRLITVDPAGLARSWRRIDDRMRSGLEGVDESTWADLEADFRDIARRDPEAGRSHEDLVGLLQSHATPAAQVTDDVDGFLRQWEHEFAKETDRTREGIAQSWSDAVAGPGPITWRNVDWIARSAGTSFADACEELERSPGALGSHSRKKGAADR